jgi:hypothetical protein
MRKITITKPDGIGILTKAKDEEWDICLNGQRLPLNLHYTTEQVEKIVATARAAGHKIEIIT